MPRRKRKSRQQMFRDVSPVDDSFRSSVQRGTRVLFLIQILSQVLSFVVLYFLYRWVSREQFGYLGMILPVIGLIRMIPVQSLNLASVQADTMTHQTLSNLFWATIALGIGATLAGFAASPLLAWFYSAPDLLPVALALSGTAVVGALGSQHQSLLERRLQIGQAAMIRFSALLIAGLSAVFAAWNGWGVWALVLQQYVELAIIAIGNFLATRFVPAMPRKFGGLKSFVKFGGSYFASNFVFNIGLNLDKYILSFLLGSTVAGRELVGLYTQAFNQMMKPVYLATTPVVGIMFPSLSRAAKSRKLYSELARDFFRLVAIILFPCGVGLFVVAEDAFTILGGEQWRFAGKILAALSLTIVGQGLINICGSLFASKGKTGRLLVCAVSFAALFAIVLAIACVFTSQQSRADRTLTFAWVYTFTTMVLLLIPYLAFCLKSNGVSVTRVFVSLIPSLLAAFFMGAVCLAAHSQLVQLEVAPAIRFVIVVVIGVLAYSLFAIGEISWAWKKFVGVQATQ